MRMITFLVSINIRKPSCRIGHTKDRMSPELRRLWAWPLALGLLTTSGLLSALVSDGWGDAWAWFALAVPVAVGGWFSLARGAR